MAKTLILNNEENTEIDITGVTSFDMKSQVGSLKWTVRAVIGMTSVVNLLSYEKFAEAAFARRSLYDHIIRDDVDTVIVDEETGSIVPQ